MFPHRRGQDCATSAFRNLLDFYGFTISESMVFGLGEGMSFWYCTLEGSPFPVLLGQNIYLEQSLCERLDTGLLTHEPRSEEEDEALVRVARGIPTVVKADPHYLEYAWRDIPNEPREHFGEHVLVVAALEGDHCWISDIWSDSLERVPIEEIKRARTTVDGYDFILPRGRWYELSIPECWPPLEAVIPRSITVTAQRMLSMRGQFGICGIRQAAKDLPRWLQAQLVGPNGLDAGAAALIARRLGENGVGPCFRTMFFRFLQDSAEICTEFDVGAIVDEFEAPIVSAWQSVLDALTRLGVREHRPPEETLAIIEDLRDALLRAASGEEDLCKRLLRIYGGASSSFRVG